ncbi:uncharacterized protein K02A2.6-like [Haliotis rufescens]|uniref:uncharacterized protein K02A2.6-like n=1 Tax=Haliotis rufescens TaxID=6454 RepID=UPI00201F8A5D|nr:uncharacterized protein K02A2.6-like [Haliotis rufescens]
MKIDTGAQVNAMSERDFLKVCKFAGPLEKPDTRLYGYGQKWLKIAGMTYLDCSYRNVSVRLKFYIVQEEAPSVLGLRACEDLNLIKVLLNIERLITDASSSEKILRMFPDIFQGLGCLEDKYSIQLDPEVKPVVHAPRKVPIALHEKVQVELQRMEDLGVIMKVEEPTEWVNSMVVVPKASGEIRLCLDPADLNKAIQREHYRMPTIQDVTSKIADHKYFTVLDAKSSYWQVQLDHDSSMLTTFNTPCGRYRFLRLPFGIKSASEVFQKRMDKIFDKLNCTHPIVDDILISGRTIEEHNKNLMDTLMTAKESGIKLNADKTQLCSQEVKFFGEILTSDGMKPDPDKVEAVRTMTTPTSKKELEGYLGMFTYLAQYSPCLSERTHILRDLIRQDSQWNWTPNHEQTFQEIKDLITRSPGPVLRYFDSQKEVVLQVDASQNGVGAVLLQEGHPVAFASKSMTSCQRNYAQIEKEMMAIVFGCEKFHHYLMGRRFVVMSDHKPLESIFMKPLHAVPLRLQRMRIRLQRYDVIVKYIPGKDIPVADMLSRHFIEEKLTDLNSFDEEVSAYVHMVTTGLPISDRKMSEIKSATVEDEQLQAVISAVQNGWAATHVDCSAQVKDFWTFREEISCVDGIVYKGSKVVIPSKLRVEMLQCIHSGHQGMTKSKERAREILFWPCMNKDIERTVERCAVCQEHRKSPCKEPMISSEVPTLPWQVVATDLFHMDGREYLVVVDYYSRYFEVALLTNTKASTVITHIKSIFGRHGVPMRVVSDNGPQYACAEFKTFCDKWKFEHITSSPLYPQANGLAEKTVQTLKQLLRKSRQSHADPYLAMLAYRNTPINGLASPAQLLMGRRLRSDLPVQYAMLRPEVVDCDVVKQAISQSRETQKVYYDQRAHPRPPIQVNDSVRLRQGKDWIPAKVVKSASTPRSLVVRTQGGSEYRRNKHDLIPTKENLPDDCSIIQSPDGTTQGATNATPENVPVQSPDTPPDMNVSQSLVPSKNPIAFSSSGRPIFRPQRFSE